jgi:glycosyltransferase involved in cell wall biosynthesis
MKEIIQNAEGDRPLRVGLFTEVFLPKIDGVVTIACLTLDHYRQRGVEALVFAAGKRVREYQGYPVVSAPGISMPFYPELELALPRGKYIEILRGFQPDIIHVMNPISIGVMGMRYGRRLDVPVIASFHAHLMEMSKYYKAGFLEEPLWWLHRQVYRTADMRMAPSLHTVAELEGRGFGKVRLWRRGVDTETFSPCFRSAEMRERLSGGHPDRLVLITVSRLAEEKQIEKLKPVLEAIPNAHLAIVGDGPHRGELEKIYAGHHATFTGYLRGRELSEAYASGDIFLFYSSPIETFGLVVAEAMASGVPAVSSRVGGVPEIIEHGVNGYLYRRGDLNGLIAAVRELSENPEKRAKMGQSARAKMETMTWPAIMDELLDVYWEVIADYKSKHNNQA